MESDEKAGNIVEVTHKTTETVKIGPEDRDEIRRGLSNFRIVLVLLSLYGISAASSLGTGLVMMGIPQIARDLSLQGDLLLW